jgi:histidinol-phosphate/aromatic aminotransferase/cobyric acid decarboxylase-like protein
MNYFSSTLMTQYPSGQKIECINASRLFNGVEEDYLCVGNGAAELINSLGQILSGNMFVSKSVFNEYIRCFRNCNFNIYDMSDNDYQFDLQAIHNNINNNDIICIVNPDNPTGAFIKFDDIISIIEECSEKGKTIIVDESFIDFANKNDRYTLLSNDILNKYNNLIVIKSISKSYGVPGIRLGVLASSNRCLVEKVRSLISVWNINSYGEYFLQIANLFKSDYVSSCDKIVDEREMFMQELGDIEGVKVYPSEANYLLCKLESCDSTLLAASLLEKNIFIKDLKTKDAFKDMDYIRLAVRTREENNYLVRTLKKELNK